MQQILPTSHTHTHPHTHRNNPTLPFSPPTHTHTTQTPPPPPPPNTHTHARTHVHTYTHTYTTAPLHVSHLLVKGGGGAEAKTPELHSSKNIKQTPLSLAYGVKPPLGRSNHLLNEPWLTIFINLIFNLKHVPIFENHLDLPAVAVHYKYPYLLSRGTMASSYD